MGKDVLCRFPYLFNKNLSSPSYFIPPFEWNTIKTDELFKIGDVTIRTQFQKHGNGFSLASFLMKSLHILPMSAN